MKSDDFKLGQCFETGKAGSQAVKVCNNLALAVSMTGISEALALGQQLGIDAHTLSNIFNSSSARCWSRYQYSDTGFIL